MDHNIHPLLVMICVIGMGLVCTFLFAPLLGEYGIVAGAISGSVGASAAFIVKAIQDK